MNKRWLLLIIIGALSLVVGVWFSSRTHQFTPLLNTAERVIMAKIVSAEPGYLTIDELVWFSGEAAKIAMQEDGVCPDKECYPPNDYYIRNASPELTRYRVSPQVEVIMQTWSHDEEGNYNWNEPVLYTDLISKLDFYSQLPFKINLKGDEIVKITEQYIP